jgi:hypothetical protein
MAGNLQFSKHDLLKQIKQRQYSALCIQAAIEQALTTINTCYCAVDSDDDSIYNIDEINTLDDMLRDICNQRLQNNINLLFS